MSNSLNQITLAQYLSTDQYFEDKSLEETLKDAMKSSEKYNYNAKIFNIGKDILESFSDLGQIQSFLDKDSDNCERFAILFFIELER